MRCGSIVLGLYLVSGAYLWSVTALEAREILSPTTSAPSSVPQQSSTVPATRGLSSGQLTSHKSSSTSFPSGSPTANGAESTELSPTQSELNSATSPAAESSHSLSPSSTYGTANPSVAQATYTASNGTNLDQLPIKPAITPALSLAGVTLILTGVVYTLIGIRTKWLHIFLSSAYLVSLAVTVLIIYVMHTPIKSAIQGGYFVAAFVTGVVFGFGSVVFPDLTEFFGCLLGGFCLSMWFLVLRPGGLIRTTVGRVVFIACFSLGTSALYFHRFTRPYGLIGSTSFAGATVIVIGIDCFSRAGLKEFWVFIWNLNDDLFPPHYSRPYPVTRGIQVEVAAIILLFLIGVVSQLKIWKIVKKRRENREAYRVAERQQQEQSDLELGKKLEEGNVKEKIRWEAAYGGDGTRKHIDSGIGTGATNTPRKPSTSGDRYTYPEKSDMDYTASKGPLKNESQVQAPTRITVRVAPDDNIYEVPSSTTDTLISAPQQVQRGLGRDSYTEEPNETPRTTVSSVVSRDVRIEESVSDLSGPKITPLPFNVRTLEKSEGDDRSSIATFPDSDRMQTSQRLSRHGLPRDLSNRKSSQSPRAENTTILYDDDQASSLAATVDENGDDINSRGDVSELGSESNHSDEDENNASEALLSERSPALLTSENLTAGVSVPDERESVRVELTKKFIDSNGRDSTEDKDGDQERGYLDHSLRPTSPPPPSMPKRSPSRVSAPSSRPSPPPSPQATKEQRNRSPLHDQLPDGASKVVMAYRTNEWAKHLEQAELPAMEDLKNPPSGNGEASVAAEAAVPVRVEALRQTPLTAEPAPMPVKQNARPQGLDHARALSSRDLLPSQQQYLNQRTSLRRSSAGRILDRSSSRDSLAPRNKHRNSSTPMLTSHLAESPIKEDVEMTFPTRVSTHPANGIMNQRSGKLQTRHSFNALSHTNSYSSLSQPTLITPTHPQPLPNNPRRHSFNPLAHANSYSPLSPSNLGPTSPQPPPQDPRRHSSNALAHTNSYSPSGPSNLRPTNSQPLSQDTRRHSSNALVHTNSYSPSGPSNLGPTNPQPLSQNQRRHSSSALAHAHSYSSAAPPAFTGSTHPQPLSQNPHRPSRTNLTPRTSATFTPFTQTPQTAQQSVAAANWRSSLQQDPRASNEALSRELDGKRAEMLMQQRRASAAELERGRREEAMQESRMGRPDLMEAHQRAMRKLQGSVKH